MSKALEFLARASKTGTPIGICDFCGGEGPLKNVKDSRFTVLACIPCCIDRRLS